MNIDDIKHGVPYGTIFSFAPSHPHLEGGSKSNLEMEILLDEMKNSTITYTSLELNLQDPEHFSEP